MNLVISWSGDESKRVATALKKWIRPVIQAVRPWMSEDIDKGSIWFGELTEKLGETAFGIVCLSRENIAAPWLLFEAGAVWKATERARVCTYLFDVKAEEVNSPLNAFQATRADASDTLRMLTTLNAHLDENDRLSEAELETAFRLAWPELEAEFEKIRSERTKHPEEAKEKPEEILASIAAAVNRIERAQLGLRQDLISEGAVEPRLSDVMDSRHTPINPLAAVLADYNRPYKQIAKELAKVMGPYYSPSIFSDYQEKSRSSAADGEASTAVEVVGDDDSETDSGE